MTRKRDTLLDEGLTLDAASGAAPAAVCVLAQAQCELRADAAERFYAVESAFGAFLELGSCAEVSASLFDRTVAALGEAREDEAQPPFPAGRQLPVAIDAAMSVQKERGWRRRFGGIEECVVEALCEPGVRARLIRLSAGNGLVEHGHEGDEYTLVLSGQFADDKGSYCVGDTCFVGPNEIHHPKVEGDEPCICFVVEFGEVKPTNPAFAAANRIFGGRYF